MTNRRNPIQAIIKDIDVISTGIPNVIKMSHQIWKLHLVNFIKPMPIYVYLLSDHHLLFQKARLQSIRYARGISKNAKFTT